jgi:hypothetical protein
MSAPNKSQTNHLGGRQNLSRGRFRPNTSSARAKPLVVERIHARIRLLESNKSRCSEFEIECFFIDFLRFSSCDYFALAAFEHFELSIFGLLPLFASHGSLPHSVVGRVALSQFVSDHQVKILSDK